jgi:hypothetical protein
MALWGHYLPGYLALCIYPRIMSLHALYNTVCKFLHGVDPLIDTLFGVYYVY